MVGKQQQPIDLPKSRWLDDEADEAGDLRQDEQTAKVAEQHEIQGPETVENVDTPLGHATGPVADNSPMAQEAAAPVHPRKRNMLLESRGKDNFEFLREIGSGTYGLVSKSVPS